MVRSATRLSTRTWSSVREFFTLREAERRAAPISASDRSEIRDEIERAAALMRAADQSRESLTRTALARQAVAQVVVATAAATQFAAGSSNEEWPELAQAIQQIGALPGCNEHSPALALLVGSDVLTDRQYRLLADLFAYVERLLELRSPRDFSIARWLRRLGFVSLGVVGCWLLLEPANLARGRMVSSSSLCKQTPEPILGLPRLGRVVDGVRIENSFAICTSSEVNPWVTVDLGAPRSIEKVVVYPRTDGPWGLADLPQQIRVSLDNEHFEVVAQSSGVYTTDFPWRVELPKKRAQYIQVFGANEAPLSLVFNEIEVYGR